MVLFIQGVFTGVHFISMDRLAFVGFSWYTYESDRGSLDQQLFIYSLPNGLSSKCGVNLYHFYSAKPMDWNPLVRENIFLLSQIDGAIIFDLCK